MYLRAKKFKFFIFILFSKLNFITSSVIDRYRPSDSLTDSDRNSTHIINSPVNSSSNNSSSNAGSSFAIQMTILSPSISKEFNETSASNLTYIGLSENSDSTGNQKELIKNLVKEENDFRDQDSLKNNEKLSTNNILTEEMINDFKMNNNNEFKEFELKNEIKPLICVDESTSIHSNIYSDEVSPKSNSSEFVDNFDLNLINKVNETLINEWIKENDNAFNLYVSESMDCMFVRSEEGVYNFQSDKNHTEVCALYLITEPNRLIEFEFIHFNVSCGEWSDSYPKNNKSLVSIVDGWEIKGEFFPGTQDHLLKRSERYKEICMNNATNRAIFRQKYRVSQNVGLIQFRILNKYEGFKVRVRFHENTKPCNVVFGMPQGIYTLKNYGQAINCSVSILFPETITIISNSIGTKPLMIDDSSLDKPSNYYDYQLNKNQSQVDSNDDPNENKLENNTIQKSTNDCMSKIENGIIHDYIELRGGSGLDTDLMMTADKICFAKELKRKKVEIDCGNTAVRLVSSGIYDNSVTVAFDLLETPHPNSFKCTQKSSFKR